MPGFISLLDISEESAAGTASGAKATYVVSMGMTPVTRNDSRLRLDLEQGRVMDWSSRMCCEVQMQSGRPVGIRVGVGRAHSLGEKSS